MKLAIAQMVLGAIIVADFAVMAVNTFTWLCFMIPYYFAFLVLGLLVLGCGIAQFLKARG
ncbi:hypothetical protein ES705_29978 [subsurface metagenome]